MNEQILQTATLAGGCFWCTEAIFKRLKGVEKVVPGYTGGSVENPTYEQVTSGQSGHAEGIQITFDPAVISYEKLLEVFFKLHDPTTLNKQGNDVGTQYRSSIFYHDETQKSTAEGLKTKLAPSYSSPIVTEIVAFTKFFPAEDYHRDYYFKNPTATYCQLIIDPKITKLYKEFGPLTKDPDPKELTV